MTERDQEELFLSPESGRTSQWRWPLSGHQKETFCGAGAGRTSGALGLYLTLMEHWFLRRCPQASSQ